MFGENAATEHDIPMSTRAINPLFLLPILEEEDMPVIQQCDNARNKNYVVISGITH